MKIKAGDDVIESDLRTSGEVSRMKTEETYVADREFTFDDLDVMTAAKNYNRWLFDQVRPSIEQGRTLEIGAGIGNLSALIVDHVKGSEVVLLEPNEVCLKALGERFGDNDQVSILPGMFPNIFLDNPAYDHSFSSILMFNVLEHIDNDLGALQVIERLLKPGGHFLLIVPAMPSLYGEIDRRLGHFRRYKENQLRQVFETAGLTVDSMRYSNMVGAVGWYVNFVLLRRNAQSGGQVWVFDNLVTPVQAAVERMIKPPFGQSLVAVGRKAG